MSSSVVTTWSTIFPNSTTFQPSQFLYMVLRSLWCCWHSQCVVKYHLGLSVNIYTGPVCKEYMHYNTIADSLMT